MAKDAEAHAEEDKKKREAVEARNLLDSAVYQAEKLKKDNDEKLSDDDKKALDEAVEAGYLVPPKGINCTKEIEGAALLARLGVHAINVPDSPRACAAST